MRGIGLVLGKPPSRSPAVGTLITLLREQGHLVRTHVPGPDGPAVPWLTDTDLVALRGLDRRALVGLRELDASDEEIERVAKAANAHDFIRELSRGYDHVVEERGSSLSGGQRQRIALARAMLSDAPIVVLDEATSSVDPENQREIEDAIRRLTDGRTTIVITHDRSSILECDRALWVDEGRVTEYPLDAHRPEGDAVAAR